METFRLFLSEYGPSLISAALTAIAGYLGMVAKRLLENFFADRAKREVVQTCVGAVEQLYAELSGEEKLDRALEAVSEMLAERGLTISPLEARMLIESAVAEYKRKLA